MKEKMTSHFVEWYDPSLETIMPLAIEEIEDELRAYTKAHPSAQLIKELGELSFEAQEELLEILVRMNEG